MNFADGFAIAITVEIDRDPFEVAASIGPFNGEDVVAVEVADFSVGDQVFGVGRILPVFAHYFGDCGKFLQAHYMGGRKQLNEGSGGSFSYFFTAAAEVHRYVFDMGNAIALEDLVAVGGAAE